MEGLPVPAGPHAAVVDDSRLGGSSVDTRLHNYCVAFSNDEHMIDEAQRAKLNSVGRLVEIQPQFCEGLMEYADSTSVWFPLHMIHIYSNFKETSASKPASLELVARAPSIENVAVAAGLREKLLAYIQGALTLRLDPVPFKNQSKPKPQTAYQCRISAVSSLFSRDLVTVTSLQNPT